MSVRISGGQKRLVGCDVNGRRRRRAVLRVRVVPGSCDAVADGASLLRKDDVTKKSGIGDNLHGLGVEVHQAEVDCHQLVKEFRSQVCVTTLSTSRQRHLGLYLVFPKDRHLVVQNSTDELKSIKYPLCEGPTFWTRF